METSLKAFELSLESLKLKNINVFDNSLKNTVLVFYDIGLFGKLKNPEEIFKDYITYKKSRK